MCSRSLRNLLNCINYIIFYDLHAVCDTEIEQSLEKPNRGYMPNTDSCFEIS